MFLMNLYFGYNQNKTDSKEGTAVRVSLFTDPNWGTMCGWG